MRILAFSRTDFHALRIGDEVRREIAAVELHALDDFEDGVEAARLFDGDDAVLADLLHRLGDDVADLFVVVRGDRADVRRCPCPRPAWPSCRSYSTAAVTASSMPLLISIGFAPAVTFLMPSRIDRLGQNGGGGGAVAGDVGGLRSDLADHLGAGVLELVLQLDLLGDGDAVLGDRRRAELLLDDDVAALRSERHLDRVRELVDAAQDRLAGFFTVCNSLGHGVSPSYSLLDDGEDFVLAQDGVLDVIDLDLGAGVLADQDRVALLDVELDALAVVVELAFADGDDFGLLRLLFGGVGDDDAAANLLLRVLAPDDDAVVQRAKLDVVATAAMCVSPFVGCACRGRTPRLIADSRVSV